MGVSGICSDVAVSRLRKTGDILFADGRIFTGISGCVILKNLLVLFVSATGWQGLKTGDFGGVITNNSQTYRQFSDMFVAILVINYESIR